MSVVLCLRELNIDYIHVASQMIDLNERLISATNVVIVMSDNDLNIGVAVRVTPKDYIFGLQIMIRLFVGWLISLGRIVFLIHGFPEVELPGTVLVNTLHIQSLS